MNATDTLRPMLATDYDGRDPKGLLMSEKLDGVRALWDGERLVSRNGRTIPAPDWFIAQLPAGQPLDGELWLGRGRFQDTAATVRKATDPRWNAMRYGVFDVPTEGTFRNRILAAAHLFPIKGERVFGLHCTTCEGRAHLDRFLAQVADKAGEGVILRTAHGLYEAGRSQSVMKLKTFSTDEGAFVRSEGNVFIVSWQGREVRLGSGLTARVKADPPAPGTPITFAFAGLTDSGAPRQASFVEVRDYE